MNANNDENSSDNHFLHAAQRTVPFLDLLGVQPISAQNGRAEFELTVGETHLRTLGLLHGGVVASLLDTAMGFAAVTKAPENFHVVTVQLNVNFIAPSKAGDTLTAVGEVQHTGRKTAVVRGEIKNQSGTLIGTATATFMFLPIE